MPRTQLTALRLKSDPLSRLEVQNGFFTARAPSLIEARKRGAKQWKEGIARHPAALGKYLWPLGGSSLLAPRLGPLGCKVQSASRVAARSPSSANLFGRSVHLLASF